MCCVLPAPQTLRKDCPEGCECLKNWDALSQLITFTKHLQVLYWKLHFLFSLCFEVNETMTNGISIIDTFWHRVYTGIICSSLQLSLQIFHYYYLVRTHTRLTRPSMPIPLKSVLGSSPWNPMSPHCLVILDSSLTVGINRSHNCMYKCFPGYTL